MAPISTNKAFVLRIGVFALLASITGTALAETNQPAEPTASAMATSGAASTSDAQINEVIVTAQRREQKLTDVPLSITAISGDDLVRSGVISTQDIELVTPGLTLQSNGPFLQPTIRGVTSQATVPGSEQNVAIYVDGVYQPFSGANAFELPDVKRIEVLKGPQGTLFGRNATGGAIQIITLDPSFQTTGKIGVAYGNFHDTDLTGYITTPLSDDIAISLAGARRSTDGWNTNLLTGREYGSINSDNVRGKLLVNAGPSVKFLLSAFYSKRLDEAVTANSLYLGNGTAIRFPGVIIPSQPYTAAPGYPTITNTENWGVSLRAEIDTGIGSITSTSAFIHNRFHLLEDGDSTTAPLLQYELFNPPRTYSQELLFSSNNFGRFSFVAGTYAYYSKSGYDPGLYIGSGGKIIQTQQDLTSATSFAGFAEGTYEIIDNLSLIAGARYTYERRYVDFNFVTAPNVQRQAFDRATPRVSLSYEVGTNANVYATYSQGFKSGQYDLSGSAPKLVQPETLNAYEVGFKTANRRLAFTAATFYSNYTDIQTGFVNPVTAINGLQNAGAARIYGAEASLKYNVSPELSFVAQGAYTHATYTNYKDASVSIPATNRNGVPIGGDVVVSRDLTGVTLARAPRLTGNIGIDYDKTFNADTLSFSTLLYYSSSYGIINGNRIKQPGYAQVNANVGWTFSTLGLKIGVYGNNLSNATVFLSESTPPTGDDVSYQERRNYGVNMEFEF